MIELVEILLEDERTELEVEEAVRPFFPIAIFSSNTERLRI